MKKIGHFIADIREQNPLVHHITNYVTVNDCANVMLAIGGSPVMADEIKEVAAITGLASSLVINMGTLNERTVPAMMLAGKTANQKNIPLIFDPVGVGASSFRNQIAEELIKNLSFSIIRGNISEIKFIAGLGSQTKGVDASTNDWLSESDTQVIANQLASKLKCIIVITGKIDIIADGTRTIAIHNGHPMLSQLTGTGCMCSSLLGAFSSVANENYFEAAVGAILTMGIAGEFAYENVGQDGNGSFRIALHDAISQMDDHMIEDRRKIYEL